jgi:hypothetical protein
MAHAPDLTRVDPGISDCGSAETYVYGQVDDRLIFTWCCDTAGGESDPVPVLGLQGPMKPEVHSAVGADVQVVDSAHRSREPALYESRKREVVSGSLWGYRLPAGKHIVQGQAVVSHAGNVDVGLVEFLT